MNKKLFRLKKPLAVFSLMLLLTFLTPQQTYAWKFMGSEEISYGTAVDGQGRVWEGWITKVYFMGILIYSEYSYNECTPN